MLHKEPGPVNTRTTLEVAFRRATDLELNELIVASTSGATAMAAAEICVGMKIVAVSYHAGFREPFVLAMPSEMRRALQERGVHVVQATHALSGVERGLASVISGVYPLQIVSETLRLFGSGTKVAVEIAIMAADAGTLSGRPIVAIGGTGSGADTALVITPADQSRFMNLRIDEVICKPDLFADSPTSVDHGS